MTVPTSFAIPIMLFADHARRDLPRFDTDRLIDYPLLVGVVTHFHISAQWKVLAERIADKAVISENAPQIGMTRKNNAIKIECLALEPVSRWPYANYRIHYRKFVIIREYLEPQPVVMTEESK